MRSISWLGGQNVLHFGGNSGWRRMLGRQAFPTSGSFTIAVTFCADPQLGGNAEILSVDGSAPFYLGQLYNGSIRAGDAWSDTGVPFPRDGRWHCLTLVRSDKETILYLDGEERARLNRGIPHPNGTDFRIGRQYGEHAEYFRGAVAEVVIFAEARTAEQVRSYDGGTLTGQESGVLTLLRADISESVELVSGLWCSGAGDTQLAAAAPAIVSYQDPAPTPVALPSGSKLFESSRVCEFYLQPEVPSNLDQFNGDGFWAGFMPMLGILTAPIAPLGPILAASGASGWMTPESKDRFSKLTFRQHPQMAGLRCRTDLTVLRRQDGRFDFVIKLHCTASPRFSMNENDDSMFRSLYQDELRVSISPSLGARNELMIEDAAVKPVTNSKSVNYSESFGWSASLGFNGRTATGDIGFSASSSTAASYDDFMVEKRTIGEQDRVEWSSSMKTLYKEDGYPDGRIYSNPDDIIVRGFFANWLLIPPALGRADLEQQYIAAYSSQSPDFADRKVMFQVRITQRLQYAETVGRGGLPKAKVGGTSIVVPYVIVATLNCIVDLKRGVVDIQPLPPVGLNARQIFRV